VRFVGCLGELGGLIRVIRGIRGIPVERGGGARGRERRHLMSNQSLGCHSDVF